MRPIARAIAAASVLVILSAAARAAEPAPDTSRGERMIDAYFKAETAQLKQACLADVKSLDDWKAKRGEYRRRLLEMLGLDPVPERTELKATVTGRVERDGVTVEKLYFQSRPGLYVTGDLYLPAGLDKPAPTILYVCGHGGVKKNGVSYGNKVAYQRHGCWFAKHGYVCLTIDSLQLGEIEAIHHGTYRYGMWWWNNRGYTPAGVEAWNCIRALDYLQSRPEVDPERIGVTGRSGGGAYSWWIAAIDDRIKVAVPVAGITDLENHVVDGCVEGHCDCMFFVNTYRWDYPMVAALVAPRPLMIGNSDADKIFPLDGVTRTYEKAKRIYGLFGAENKITLNVTPGPHKDTPELRVPAFRWFNKYLKGEEGPVEDLPEGFFTPQELKVFDKLPADQINTEIHETFVKTADPPRVPKDEADWESMRDGWRKALLEKTFAGWPKEPGPLNIREVSSEEREGARLKRYEFDSQEAVRLPLYVFMPPGDEKHDKFDSVSLRVLDDTAWQNVEPRLQSPSTAAKAPWTGPIVYFCPRGVGPTAWYPAEKKQIQIRRRFMLLGQTLDGMRVWDVRRAMQAIRSLPQFKDAGLDVSGESNVTAGIALYAAMFEPRIASLRLVQPPATHRDGPILLNVRKVLDMPQAVAMAAERSSVGIITTDPDAWQYPSLVAAKLGWAGHLRIANSSAILNKRKP